MFVGQNTFQGGKIFVFIVCLTNFLGTTKFEGTKKLGCTDPECSPWLRPWLYLFVSQMYRVSIKSLYNLKKLLKSEMMRYRNEVCFMLISIS